ncbi:MAG: hypothetical protein M0Z69_00730 [Actinomycetota bacterium]|nr:hypothetical protein [Actinomycetota bacterium]
MIGGRVHQPVGERSVGTPETDVASAGPAAAGPAAAGPAAAGPAADQLVEIADADSAQDRAQP